jgi:site-specific recombinase XerD
MPAEIVTIEWVDAVEQFTTHLANNEIAVNTIRAYRGDLGLLAKWYQSRYQEPIKLGELGMTELREWKVYLRETCHQEAASVNRRIVAAKKFTEWAVEVNYAKPLIVPRSIKKVEQPPKWLSPLEQKKLRREVEKTGSPRDAAVITFLLHTGLRVDELIRLQWGDLTVSPRMGEITVRKGKGSKERTFSLNIEARAALGVLKGLGKGTAKYDRVVEGQRGPINARGIQLACAKYAQRTGLDFTPHVLRHTFCKNLDRAGTPIATIAKIAGHSSLETTRRYITPGRDEIAAELDKLAGRDD